jgi:hypothetical protein
LINQKNQSELDSSIFSKTDQFSSVLETMITIVPDKSI